MASITAAPSYRRKGKVHDRLRLPETETGLLDRAARDLAIDLKGSFMIGDKWSDVELGHRAGMRSILVRTGFSPDEPGNKRPAHVATLISRHTTSRRRSSGS